VINRAHGVWCPYCYRTRRDGIDADAARKSGGFFGFLSTFRGLFARRGGVAIVTYAYLPNLLWSCLPTIEQPP